MAKKVQSVSFSKACINLEDRTITETTKDEIKVYSLDELLNEWDNVEGITLSIKKDVDVPAIND